MKLLASRVIILISLVLAAFPLYAQNTPPSAASAPPAPPASPSSPAASPATPPTASSTASATVIPPAPDEATLKAAATLIELTQTSNLIDQMVPLISKNFDAIVLRDNPGKEAVIDPLIQRSFTSTFAAHIEGLKRHLAFVYASKLTHDQLEQLIIFYRSPVGQAYLKVMPTLMTQSMLTTKMWMTDNIHEAVHVAIDNLKKNNLAVPKELESK